LESVTVRFHARGEIGQRFGIGRSTSGRALMVEAGLLVVEAGLQVEDGPPMLDRNHPSGRETAAVTNAINLVQDGDERVAWTQEIGVQRVHHSAGFVNGACRGHQSLASHLATEDPLAFLVGRASTEQVHLDRFEIEQSDQVVERGGHVHILPSVEPAVATGPERRLAA
jgi:hypothetical protein